MHPKSEEFKTAMSAIRERIATAKRQGSRSGFIDYYGCMSVTNDFIGILKEADEAAEHGEYTFAYSVAALILINLAKLAGTADDSVGGVTDARRYVTELLEKVCKNVEYGTEDAGFIFVQAIKDSKNKAFDGWEEFAYDLLQPAAGLATTKNVDKLYETLDEFSANLSQEEYSSWHLECDSLVRYSAIKAACGEEAGERFIEANLKYDGIRRIAVENAVADGDYNTAEKLCLEKIDSIDYGYHRTRVWSDRLFDIFIKAGNKNKQAELAESLLINEKDIKYYDILKQLLIEKDTWKLKYPLLLERLSQTLPTHMYQWILSQEGEMRRLFTTVENDPPSVFDYGKQLSAEFPAEIQTICFKEILNQAVKTKNRKEYRKLCGLIKKLFEFGGIAETERVILELKEKYPRRPAMIEELDKLSVRLEKKKSK